MDEQTLKDVDSAFKALEERDELLDKIRADIEKEIVPRNSDQYNPYEVMWQNMGLRKALKVIDKYRKE